MYPGAKCEHAGGAFKEVMRGFRSERLWTGGVKSGFPEVRHYPAHPSSQVVARSALGVLDQFWALLWENTKLGFLNIC